MSKDTETFRCATATHVRPIGECPHCTLEAIGAECRDLHEKVAALESREVCTQPHENVETCGYCQRDALAAELAEAKRSVEQVQEAQWRADVATIDRLRAALRSLIAELRSARRYPTSDEVERWADTADEALRGSDQPAKGLDPYAHYPTIDGTNMTTEELATAFKLTTQTAESQK